MEGNLTKWAAHVVEPCLAIRQSASFLGIIVIVINVVIVIVIVINVVIVIVKVQASWESPLLIIVIAVAIVTVTRAANSVFLARNPRFRVFWLPKRINRNISCITTKVRKWQQMCKNSANKYIRALLV